MRLRLASIAAAIAPLAACNEPAPPNTLPQTTANEAPGRLTGDALRAAVRGRTLTYPRNRVAFACDGTLVSHGDHGPVVTGVYEIQDDRVCATPTVVQETDCFALFRDAQGGYYTSHVYPTESSQRSRVEISDRVRSC